MTTRRIYEADEKVRIVRRHLLDGVAVSDLCDELGIKPTQYYAWQKQLFENGLAFQRRNGKSRQQPNRELKKIAALEEKLRKRDEVVAELLQEHVQLKKELGEL